MYGILEVLQSATTQEVRKEYVHLLHFPGSKNAVEVAIKTCWVVISFNRRCFYRKVLTATVQLSITDVRKSACCTKIFFF